MGCGVWGCCICGTFFVFCDGGNEMLTGCRTIYQSRRIPLSYLAWTRESVHAQLKQKGEMSDCSDPSLANRPFPTHTYQDIIIIQSILQNSLFSSAIN